MLMRVAESHLRFGHFEHFYYARQPDQVKKLADFAITHHWPQWQHDEQRYSLWFTDIVERTARMVAHWQAVRFAHGVMNTDNMSILGLTFDYGPYGFMDDYQPDFVCNHSDYHGRYAFDNQPAVALWNLHRLAQALSGLLSVESLETALGCYEPALMAYFGQLMRTKLGFFDADARDNDLLVGLLNLMAREHSNYTRTFRLLSDTNVQQAESPLRDLFIDRAAFDAWFRDYRARLAQEAQSDAERQRSMKAANPKYILRNYLAQQAIEAAEQDDIGPLTQLHQALSRPYDEQPEYESLAAAPPAWGKALEVSCSS